MKKAVDLNKRQKYEEPTNKGDSRKRKKAKQNKEREEDMSNECVNIFHTPCESVKSLYGITKKWDTLGK